MQRYTNIIPSPMGAVSLVGATMTPEREREIARVAALCDMPSFGLKPCDSNLARYYQLVREALA